MKERRDRRVRLEEPRVRLELPGQRDMVFLTLWVAAFLGENVDDRKVALELIGELSRVRQDDLRPIFLQRKADHDVRLGSRERLARHPLQQDIAAAR